MTTSAANEARPSGSPVAVPEVPPDAAQAAEVVEETQPRPPVAPPRSRR